jgi:CBS domain-containing protein
MNAALPLYPASSPVVLGNAESGLGVLIEPSAPATSVMTDFRFHATLAVPSSRPIDEALSDMKHAGVRALFVTDGQDQVGGFITSYDIQGERPIRFLQSTDCLQERCARSGILVSDIMTPVHDLKVLHINDVLNATVGDLADTFKITALTHLLVVEEIQNGGGMRVRGLFSRTVLERATGLKIEALCTAQSFGDVEQVLTHPDCSC